MVKLIGVVFAIMVILFICLRYAYKQNMFKISKIPISHQKKIDYTLYNLIIFCQSIGWLNNVGEISLVSNENINKLIIYLKSTIVYNKEKIKKLNLFFNSQQELNERYHLMLFAKRN